MQAEAYDELLRPEIAACGDVAYRVLDVARRLDAGACRG
jgi:hypothetical protein